MLKACAMRAVIMEEIKMDQYIDVLIADRPTREKIIEMAQGGGGGGGSSNIEILHRDEDYFLNVSYNDLLSMLNNGVIPFYVDTWEDGALAAPLINLNYDGENYVATFMDIIFAATTATDPLVISE